MAGHPGTLARARGPGHRLAEGRAAAPPGRGEPVRGEGVGAARPPTLPGEGTGLVT